MKAYSDAYHFFRLSLPKLCPASLVCLQGERSNININTRGSRELTMKSQPEDLGEAEMKGLFWCMDF